MNLLDSLLVFTSLTFLLHQSILNNKLSLSNIWEELRQKNLLFHIVMPRTISLFSQTLALSSNLPGTSRRGKLWQTSIQAFLFAFSMYFCSNFVTRAFPELYVVWLWYKTFMLWHESQQKLQCTLKIFSSLFSTSYQQILSLLPLSLDILAYCCLTGQTFFRNPHLP